MVVGRVHPAFKVNMSVENSEKLALRITLEGVTGVVAVYVRPHFKVRPEVMS